MICPYASSGCNSPEGECIGLCLQGERRDNAAELKFMAMDLIDEASSRGFNLTISRDVCPINPQLSVATVDVWPKRSAV